ncbi:MAG: hypothetical protein EXS25_06700 [Pedosphaera sp.]|nr:hypothetical protein [Pedosphaera sp.]
MIRAFLVLILASLPLVAATRDPARLIRSVARGLVQVEFDLQFDKGDAPHGILDQDPRSSGSKMNTLAELVAEERPLETSGFLVTSNRVIAMDPCVHPRFIKGIIVRQGDRKTTAKVTGYFREHWALVLTLDQPVEGSVPLHFETGRSAVPSGLVSYFRQDGQMIRALLPFGGQWIETPEVKQFRVSEHEGVAVAADGKVLGLVLNHRLDSAESWRGNPLLWAQISGEEFSSRLKTLEEMTSRTLVRVRLSFRSPKATPGQTQARFRGRNEEESEDETATERDVLGVVLSGGKVAVLVSMKPSTTARLEHILVFPGGSEGIAATFEASLRDFGVIVVRTEKPLPSVVSVDPTHPAELLGRLLLRAEIALQGETRLNYFHLARIAGVRVGARLEPYPEVSDPEVKDTFLFSLERQLFALPIVRRDSGVSGREPAAHPRQLTTARLLESAVRRLPESADPANVPVSEAEENRLAWIGVEMQPLSRELARANGASDQTRDGQSGGLITYVHRESPGAKAGIKPGMILLRLRSAKQPLPIEVQLEEDFARAQGFPWERLDEIRAQFFERIPTPWPPAETAFTRALTDLGFGTKFNAELLDEGRLLKVDFVVEAGPLHYEAAKRFKSESLGVTVRDLTYDVRRYIQRGEKEPGVVVSRIEAGGRASVAGVKPYELVTHIDDQEVSSVADFARLTAGSAELKLTLKRMSKGRIVTIKALTTGKSE